MSINKVPTLESIDLHVHGQVTEIHALIRANGIIQHDSVLCELDRYRLDEILRCHNFHRVGLSERTITDVTIVLTYYKGDWDCHEILVYRTDGYNTHKHTSKDECVNIVEGLLRKREDLKVSRDAVLNYLSDIESVD